MNRYFETLFLSEYGGNPYALATNMLLGVVLSVVAYRRTGGKVSIMFVWALYMAFSNVTRLLK